MAEIAEMAAHSPIFAEQIKISVISVFSVGLIKKIFFFPRILSKLVNALRQCSTFANEIRTSFPWDLWSIQTIRMKCSDYLNDSSR